MHYDPANHFSGLGRAGGARRGICPARGGADHVRRKELSRAHPGDGSGVEPRHCVDLPDRGLGSGEGGTIVYKIRGGATAAVRGTEIPVPKEGMHSAPPCFRRPRYADNENCSVKRKPPLQKAKAASICDKIGLS